MKTVKIKVEIEAEVRAGLYCAEWSGSIYLYNECQYLSGFVRCSIFDKYINKDKKNNLKKCRKCLDACEKTKTKDKI